MVLMPLAVVKSAAGMVILFSASSSDSVEATSVAVATLGILKVDRPRGLQLIIPFHLPSAMSVLYLVVSV